MMSETRINREGRFDWPLVIVVYALSIFGILCITMATYVPSVSENLPLLNKILASRSGMWQSIFLVVSPLVIGVIVAIPTEIIRARARLAYLGVLALLVVTLVVGQVSNGLRGWLKSDLLGRSIQASEFSKLSVLLMLAQQLARSEKPMSKFKDFMRTMLIVGVPALAVLAQGETGTVIVIAFMFMAMIYFAGVDIRIILTFIVLGMLGVGAIVAYGMLSETTDYRILRLLAFMDPEKYRQTGGYQILMSQKAIGAGQMTGVGTFLPGSWTTLGFVPESSTDAIFTVVGECFGFVGCAGVLLTYLFIILRMIFLARFTDDKFCRLVIVGVVSMLLFHVFQNVAMSMGIMPITGIPLPFLSYGGSNFISNIAAVALVLNIARNGNSAAVTTVPLPKMNTVR
ncbi:MAG: rod shape-determining protein RodA [Clostridia bacterium]|nr:rod shape-determining protein RodA [Clostridia bacterium]